jgi:hypothetical protein
LHNINAKDALKFNLSSSHSPETGMVQPGNHNIRERIQEPPEGTPEHA